MKKLLATILLTLAFTGCSFSINFGDSVSVDSISEPEPTPDAIEKLLE